MRACLISLLTGILLSACSTALQIPDSQPTWTPVPTYTPYPTWTPVSTYTPYPTYTPHPTYTPLSIVSGVPAESPSPTFALSPTPTNASVPQLAPGPQCIDWTDAGAHLGERTCVRGMVFFTYQSGDTFFIDFDDTRTSFYAVSFKYSWGNLRGHCVEISGTISSYRERPQIIIEKSDQVKTCPDKTGTTMQPARG